MARSINARCFECGADNRYHAVYAGCRRPCGSCGAVIELVDPEVPGYVPRHRLCWNCAAERGPDSPGLAFEWVTCRRNTDWETPLRPYLGSRPRLLGCNRMEELSVTGWACPRCEGKIRTVRAWLAYRWFVCAIAAAGAAAAFSTRLGPNFEDPYAFWPVVVFMFCVAFFPCLILHWSVLFALARPVAVRLEMGTPSTLEVEPTGQRSNVAAE